MASIRRALSPVPRAGGLMNGEVVQTPSPLSKSMSCAQQYPSSSGLFSSILGISDSQPFVLGVFSPRSSRLSERSKPKGQIWRRALFHFFVCFMVGVFIGLTPFVSMNLSSNLMPKHQGVSFEVVSTVGDFHSYEEGITRNATSILETGTVYSNATSEPVAKEIESFDVTSNETGFNFSLSLDANVVSRKLLIVVTPTYARLFQTYYLNQLAYTLKLVQPPLLWIVVEMTSQSEETANILRRTGVMYRHLVCNKNLTDVKDRSVLQRNVALSHIETHRLNGIVYFADDDNIYSSDLFEQIRQIRRFGTWTVAKLTGNGNKAFLEGPICNGTGVIGWHANETTMRFRRFHADMSGFAFNSTILWDPKQWHRSIIEPIRHLDTVKDGFQASTFINQVVEDESQMEGLMEDCSRVMVWSLRLQPSDISYPPKWFLNSNLDVNTELAKNS